MFNHNHASCKSVRPQSPKGTHHYDARSNAAGDDVSTENAENFDIHTVIIDGRKWTLDTDIVISAGARVPTPDYTGPERRRFDTFSHMYESKDLQTKAFALKKAHETAKTPGQHLWVLDKTVELAHLVGERHH